MKIKSQKYCGPRRRASGSRHFCPLPFALCLLIFLSPSLWAQNVPVKEVILDNGMKLLLVQRKGSPSISAGWIAKVGSVNEHAGVTRSEERRVGKECTVLCR